MLFVIVCVPMSVSVTASVSESCLCLCSCLCIKRFSSYKMHILKMTNTPTLLRVCGDLQQPKVFQLYWGLQGLTGSLLQVLDLKMKRYPPITSPDNAAGGIALPPAHLNPSVPPTLHANNKELEITLKVEGQRQEHTTISPYAQTATTARCCLTTPVNIAKTDSRCLLSASLIATSERESVIMKSKEMVNLVDFVPFLHHRGTSSGSEDGGEHVEHPQESRDPLDFSDIVQDMQVC